MELLRGIRLVPVTALELFNDDAALDIFENVEQAGIGVVFEERVLEGASSDVAWQETAADDGCAGKYAPALDDVLEFADIAWPIVIDQGAHGIRSELAWFQVVFLGEV